MASEPIITPTPSGGIRWSLESSLFRHYYDFAVMRCISDFTQATFQELNVTLLGCKLRCGRPVIVDKLIFNDFGCIYCTYPP
jgi:hypothetical protein